MGLSALVQVQPVNGFSVYYCSFTLGKDFQLEEWTKVCSLHFKPTDFYNFESSYRTLREDAVPSIFAFPTKETSARRQLNRANVDEEPSICHTVGTEPGVMGDELIEEEVSEEAPEDVRLKEANDEIDRLRQMLSDAKMEIIELRKGVSRKRFGIDAIQESDKDVHYYTGLPSTAVFYRLLEYLSPAGKQSNVVYKATAQKWIKEGMEPGNAEWREGDSQVGRPATLSQEDEFFLMLVRLCLDLKEYDLAKRFEISPSSVSRIFSTWINYCYLRLGSLPCWPSRDTIRNTMPAVFKEQYPKTTAILDATEIKVHTPSSLLLQSQTYSSYKSANTFKALLAVSPAGHVIFTSALYTGSISDYQLVSRSGFLGLLQEGDEIMADRGFTIEDLLTPLGVGLNIPPFLGKRQQMDGAEVVETQQIASLRIHVERAIRRVKEFDILAGIMPATLAGSANQIWTVCCLLTNLQNPILSC